MNDLIEAFFKLAIDIYVLYVELSQMLEHFIIQPGFDYL